jgi:hypothetical protein
MKEILFAALGVALFASAATAEAPSAPVPVAPSTITPVMAVSRPTVTSSGAALPINTEVWLSPNVEVNSKRIKQGEKST